MTKDPVCGMKITEKNAPSSIYRGELYEFCGEDCKQAFDEDPEEYIAEEEQEEVRRA